MSSRIVEVEINGTKYPLCFTLYAFKKVSEKYGSLETCLKELDRLILEDQSKGLDEHLWMLKLLLDAGREALAHEDAGYPEPPDLKTLEKSACFGDCNAVIEAIRIGNSREVGAEAPKNGEGAEAAASAPNG